MNLSKPYQLENIMEPRHPLWSEFCNRLWSQIEEVGCKGGNNLSAELLKSYDVNIAESLAYFMDHGGFCDCEVLLNVDRI